VASPLTIHRAGGTVWCTLDRPPLNLFEPTLIRAVRESFDALAADRLQKELIVRWRESDLPTAVRHGINAFATAYATDEPLEGMSAYLEKRRPSFTA